MSRKLTYEEWEHAVDRLLVAMCGMGVNDLPDTDTYALYDSGYTPERAAKRTLRDAMADF